MGINEVRRYEVKRLIRDDVYGDLRPGSLPSHRRVATWDQTKIQPMINTGMLALYGGSQPPDPDPPGLADRIATASAAPEGCPPSEAAAVASFSQQPQADDGKKIVRGRARKGKTQ